MVRKLVVQPDGFMERKVGQPNIRREILTVLFVGVLGAVGVGYVGDAITQVTDTELAVFSVIGVAAAPVVGALVLWVGYSVALHLISGQFDARGPIRRLFKLTAWALIPVGVGNLINSVGLYLAYQNVDAAAILEETPAEPVQTVLTAVTAEPVYLGAAALSVLLVLWTGYLLVFAVQNAKGLSRDAALKVVAVPVAVHVLYVVWTIVQSLTG